ncbi:hypothetical protein INT47_007952, partial [Mucor saturninus]
TSDITDNNILDTEQGPIEAVTGEFANNKSTNQGKLYHDKLKLCWLKNAI